MRLDLVFLWASLVIALAGVAVLCCDVLVRAVGARVMAVLAAAAGLCLVMGLAA